MPRPLWALLGAALGVILAAAVVMATHLDREPTLSFDADEDEAPQAIVDTERPGDDGPGFFAPGT